MMQKRFHAFISYNSKDQGKINDLVKGLQRNGFKVWYDSQDMVSGAHWIKLVKEKLSESKVCAVFFSDQGWGPHHLEEVKIALEIQEIKIIPVLLPGVTKNIETLNKNFHEPSGILKEIIYLDFRDRLDIQEAITLLGKAILGEGKGSDWSVKLEHDARNWKEKRHDLYSSKLLREISRLEKENPQEISDLGKEFLNASKKNEERLKKRRSFILVGISIFSCIFIAICIFLLFYFSPQFLYPPPTITKISIPSGSFQQSPNYQSEAALQNYTLNDYEIAEKLVTGSLYNICVKARKCNNLSNQNLSGITNPVSNVTWHEADNFCRWVGGRLPTNIELQKLYSIQEPENGRFEWASDWCYSCSPPNAYKIIQGLKEDRSVSPEARLSYLFFRCAWDTID